MSSWRPPPPVISLRDSFRELSEDFKTKGLEANASIMAEVHTFQAAIKDVILRSEARAKELISVYDKRRKHVRVQIGRAHV